MTADLYPLQVLLVTLAGWVNRHQQHVIEYLVEENLPQGAVERPPPAADGRSAPTPRGEGSPGPSTGLAAGRDDRDPRHDPAMAPAADHPEVDLHAEAARPPRDHPGDLVAHSAHEHGESRVGLHANPGGAEEPGPRSSQEYGRQGCSGPTGFHRLRTGRPPGGRSSGPTGARSRGPTSSPPRSGPSRADHLLHALRDRSPKSTGSHGRLDAHPGWLVHGAGGAPRT
jgi:hypothetical protein